MVLQDEIAGVRPVVGKIAFGVVAGGVIGALIRSGHTRGAVRARTRGLNDARTLHETIHPAVVDVSFRDRARVRAVRVDVGVVGKWTDTRSRSNVGEAHGRDAVLHRYSVRTGERPEVIIERAVLLHDHDDVLDLVDAGHGSAVRRPGSAGGCAREAAQKCDTKQRPCDPFDAHPSFPPAVCQRRQSMSERVVPYCSLRGVFTER